MTEPDYYYFVFDAGAGWLGILGSVRGLRRITLPESSYDDALRRLGNDATHATYAPGMFDDLMGRFRAYFDGRQVTFPDELDLSSATPFQRQVWTVTRHIPRGETRSYRWVAEQSGKPHASRVVGQALARNLLPIIIPCHRVVATDGQLGGYSGGLEMKRRFLSLEATQPGTTSR